MRHGNPLVKRFAVSWKVVSCCLSFYVLSKVLNTQMVRITLLQYTDLLQEAEKAGRKLSSWGLRTLCLSPSAPGRCETGAFHRLSLAAEKTVTKHFLFGSFPMQSYGAIFQQALLIWFTSPRARPSFSAHRVSLPRHWCIFFTLYQHLNTSSTWKLEEMALVCYGRCNIERLKKVVL